MQRLGEVLRELRRKRGLSQERLAAQAQVTGRALRYWEVNQQQPREVELENVLTALQATPQERAQVFALLTDTRSVRLARSGGAAGNVPTSTLGPLPGIGDLLRAVRVRGGWTQERLAESMGISRATIIRWEATRTLPSEEDMKRLCLLLPMAPEEQAALQARRLSPSSWAPQLTLEACYEQYETLLQIRGGKGPQAPLADMHALALKRQLRSLLGQSSEALNLLAKVEVQHSWWLYMQGRRPEACAGNWRALNMVRGKFAPEMFWVWALNLLAAHAVRGARETENGVKLLYPWLSYLPAASRPYLLWDMALYAGNAQRPEEAALFLQQAQQTWHHISKENTAGDWYYDWYYRMTTARVLFSSGKAVEALKWLPATELAGDGRIASIMIWAEICLAAGERNLTSGYLREAQTLLVAMPLPERQSKLEHLTRLL